MIYFGLSGLPLRQRMRVKCGVVIESLGLGGGRVAYFSSPFGHRYTWHSVAVQVLPKIFKAAWFFLFTLDHPFWMVVNCVSHSPFLRSNQPTLPFFFYMGSSSCSNNKHKSQEYIHVTSPSRNYHDWEGRGILSRLEHLSCPECAVSSIHQSLPSPWFLSFEGNAFTLPFPPLGSYLLLPSGHCSFPILSGFALLIFPRTTAGTKRKPLFFHARGY